MTSSNEESGDQEPAANGPYQSREPSGAVPEFLLELFRDLDPRVQLSESSPSRLDGLIDPAVFSDKADRVPRRTSRVFPWTLALAAMLLAMASGIRTFGVSRALSETKSLYNKMKVTATLQGDTLEVLQPTEPERKEGLLVRYISPDELAIEREGIVSVTARNVQLPCVLLWTVDGEAQTVTLPTGETKLTLPIGNPVTLFCRPFQTAGWFQAVQLWMKRGSDDMVRLGCALGQTPLKLQDNDELIVFFEDPIPPWNALYVPVQDESILVTLERPWAEYDIDKWLDVKWDGQEEFPNTALFWARDGSVGLARELAEYFLQHRDEPDKWVRFRGNAHTSMTVFGNGTTVSSQMQEITHEELESVLFEAFERLRRRMAPDGRLIEEEITDATLLMLVVD